jgi:L-ascorbate 6-phosphate lactonase
MIATKALGQSGYRLELGGIVVYIDPYLSDNVEAVEGGAMRRQFPLPVSPSRVADADWILVTHAHIDHCDLHTLVPVSVASPRCRIVCPQECAHALVASGVARERIVIAEQQWRDLAPSVRVLAVPAAHPRIERDDAGNMRFVGYVLEWDGRRIYHAGDTSLVKELHDVLVALSPLQVVFLPVNERNYYREQRGIIGNMTLREAFQLAEDVRATTLVPMHWDMFLPNSVFREEIELLYRLAHPSFELRIYPTAV